VNGQDLFVGGISITLGVVALAAAIGNISVFFQTRRAAWLEGRWGRGGVRLTFAVAGTILILLGFTIIAGFRLYGADGARGNQEWRGDGGGSVRC